MLPLLLHLLPAWPTQQTNVRLRIHLRHRPARTAQTQPRCRLRRGTTLLFALDQAVDEDYKLTLCSIAGIGQALNQLALRIAVDAPNAGFNPFGTAGGVGTIARTDGHDALLLGIGTQFE